MASTNVLKNIGLDDHATGRQTFNDDEPTAASSGDEIFVTGNVYASRSSDGGSTWTFVNPFTTFPATEGGFCCDQVVVHERSRDLWAWLLQYRTGPTGTNIARLAVATGKPEGWVFFDFAPSGVDPQWGANTMFDYPHMATSDNHLYFSFNVFKLNPEQLVAAVVFKIALDGLANKDLTGAVEVFRESRFGSLCLTGGATTDMFFGSHHGVGPLHVFRWPDAAGSAISEFDTTPSAWNGRGGFRAPGPRGEWLDKLDSRITGAWTVGDEAGFLWSAQPRTGRPQPYVKGVIVDTNARTVVAEPDIFSEDFAWAYPATHPNADGQVGLSIAFGGGQFNPSHAVGFLDGHQWAVPFVRTKVGTDAPTNRVWGDYLSVAPHNPEGRSWVASGFTLQGGNALEDLEPRYVEFAAGP